MAIASITKPFSSFFKFRLRSKPKTTAIPDRSNGGGGENASSPIPTSTASPARSNGGGGENASSPTPISTASPARSNGGGGENVSSPIPTSTASRGRSNGENASSSTPITEEDEFRRVFAFLDANDDGKISADELRVYFSSVGDTAALEEADKIIGQLCGEESFLGFEEFVGLMEKRDGGEDNIAVLRGAFEVFEVEKGSGCITAEGLTQVLRRMGVEVKSVEECRAMIGVYDLDGNGVLDFDEFKTMMT